MKYITAHIMTERKNNNKKIENWNNIVLTEKAKRRRKNDDIS